MIILAEPGMNGLRPSRIKHLHDRYGHIQKEIIIQNFRAKPGTQMSDKPEPLLEDLKWTISQATSCLARISL